MVITKPDKGAGVVLLDYADYVILDDTSKFLKLRPMETHDCTALMETKFQRQLLKWVKNGLLSSDISVLIRPTGSIRPRLHGLPKIHKDGFPLRSILSMIGSS